MTFDNLCEIIDAKRLNFPSVNAYEKIETKAHLVKRGDLFVGNDADAIKQAIDNGAYGILHSVDTIMIDEEVAWMKVPSTNEALIKILRFSLLTSQAQFFLFSSIEYALLKQISKKEKLIFLRADPAQDFKKILSAKSDSFFIADNQAFLTRIYPEFISYHDRRTPLIKLTQQTLFLSSFTYEDVHYEDIKLPAIFLPSLNVVLHYLKEHALDFDIERLHFLEYFKPLFVSNRLTIRPFGHSEHAFIVVPKAEHIELYLDYIMHFATWANVLLFLPKTLKFTSKEVIEVHHYETLEEVKKIDVDKFNFILILANYNELSLILENNRQENTISLF